MRALLVGASAAAIVFLGFAFGQWSLNPATWDELARGFCGGWMTLIGGGAAVLSRLLSSPMDEDD
jgi:hypothetical protein